MADINAEGNTLVASLKRKFREEYGFEIRIYHGAKFADDKDTLASIRPKGATSEGSISINGNMLVGNVEKKFLDQLGIRVQIENREGKLADNNVTLSSLRADNTSIPEAGAEQASVPDAASGQETVSSTVKEDATSSMANVQAGSSAAPTIGTAGRKAGTKGCLVPFILIGGSFLGLAAVMISFFWNQH